MTSPVYFFYAHKTGGSAYGKQPVAVCYVINTTDKKEARRLAMRKLAGYAVNGSRLPKNVTLREHEAETRELAPRTPIHMMDAAA